MTKPKQATMQEKVLAFRKHPVSHPMCTGSFVPYYQSLVDFRTGYVTGFEVLARWRHPTDGLILPEKFIPQAEREDWIGELTQRMLDQALIDIDFFRPRRMLSLNVSPSQLLSSALPEQIATAAGRAHYNLANLTIEVTETAFTANRERASSIARELKAMGCRLSLDDFGTGYSSLLHLQALPFDQIKVDRSFVQSMLCRRESRKIVAAVIGLGQSLGITTVAEGIETQAQLEQLKWLGCDLGQGWLFGPPMPGADLASYTSAFEQDAFHIAQPKDRRLTQRDMNSVERLAQLQALYHDAPVGLAFLDRQQRYRNLNQRLADMNGLALREHLGRTVQEVLPSLYPVLKPYLDRALEGEHIKVFTLPSGSSSHREGEQCRSEQRTRQVSYQPAFDEGGEVIGVSVAVLECVEPSLSSYPLQKAESVTSPSRTFEELRSFSANRH